MESTHSWREIDPGSGLFVYEYFCSSFGPANAIAIADGNGGMSVLSPPPLSEGAQQEGLPYPVRSLIAPNIGHRSGLKSWVAKYGDIAVYAPRVALGPLQRAGFDARHVSDFPEAPGLAVMEPQGTRAGLTFVRSTRGSRPVCYLDEVVINLSDPPKSVLSRVLFRLYGVARGPGLNHFFLKVLCNDGEGVMRQARDFAYQGAILIGAHGDAIKDGARRLLGTDATTATTR
jgi:hypothetical protein